MATSLVPPYKQFLTPALHRRFTSAAVAVFAICYVEAILVGAKHSFFWSWFPLGVASIKTLLLFLSALSIFVLRVAQLHLGARTVPSRLATLVQNVVRLETIQTLAWYLFSAWWFSEIYVWSASESADLGWITLGEPWERRKLNERPIYLRSVFFIFALLQSGLHLYYDYDQVVLSTDRMARPENVVTKSSGIVAYTRTQFTSQMRALQPLFWYDKKNIVLSIVRNIVLRVVFVSCITPFLYGLFIRRTAWNWSLYFAALFQNLPVSRLSYIPPHYPSLMARSVSSGFFLVLLWEASNIYFTSYVAGAPLKKGQPLSNESKDPNGSLLNGLKSRREIPKTFALWELSHIAAHPSVRRKSLFVDIDRPSGTLWSQILGICLLNINAISSRINPPKTPNPASQPVQLELLPRIAPPLRQDPTIFAKATPSTAGERFEASVGAVAKSWGQSPNPGTLKLPSKVSQNLSPKRLLSSTSTGQKVLTQGSSTNAKGPSSGLFPLLHTYTMTFLRSPLGVPFRRTLSRRACSVILGTPISELHPLLSSTRVLSDLAVASLTEDPYGKVAKDVPTLLRTFVATIRSIDSFVGSLEIHWTDVEGQAGDVGKRQIPEIDMLVAALKDGLGAMVQAFGEFAGELGIGEAEIIIARQIAGLGGEMREVAR